MAMFRRTPFFPRSRVAWVPSKAAAGTISVTNPVQYKTYQRSGTTGSIVISGTYTGSPTAIEASFNGGAYSTIDAAPAGGTFSGSLSGQAQGQGTLTVRFTNDTGVSATVADVGIGDVFIVAGDSIAEGRATNAQSYTHATLKATAFNQSDAWINGNDPIDIHAANGSHWPLLASQIMEDQGVPVAFITVGTGSSDIAGSSTQWVKNNSAYAEMTSQVTASGVNAVKAALFHLGPNAVVNASTISQATYNAAVDTLASNIASDIAGAPKLHLGVFGEVTTGSPPDRRAAIDNIRAAIIEAQDDNSNVEPGPVLIDQDYSDGVHPKSDAELAIVAKRWWVALDESLYGGSGGRGPRLVSAKWNHARDELTVTFDRNLKTGLSFGAGAWIISDNGTPMTITGVAYHGTDAAAVVLTTNAAASGALGTTTVSFASSNDAAGIVIPVSTDVTAPVGAAVQLPAEPLYAEAVAESGTTTISVPAASLSLTGYAPTVVAPQNVPVPAAGLTLTALEPTVRVGADQVVAVPLGELTLTGFAPVVATTGIVSIPVGSLTLTGYAPTVTNGEEVAPTPMVGAGRPRRQSQRVVVEIDGEDFIAESVEEARALLDKAKDAAEEKASIAVKRATEAKKRPARKIVADARKSLALPTINAPGLEDYAGQIAQQIEDLYRSTIRTIEVESLLHNRDRAEEDDEDILLLIA